MEREFLALAELVYLFKSFQNYHTHEKGFGSWRAVHGCIMADAWRVTWTGYGDSDFDALHGNP